MAHQIHDGNRKGVNDFFARCGLPPDTLERCWNFMRTRYPKTANVSEAPDQGFCSYTLYLNSDTIVQFRPPAHKFDLEIIALARQTYGELVPKTDLIGGIGFKDPGKAPIDSSHTSSRNNSTHLSIPPSPSILVYSQSRIQGISLANLNTTSTQHREPLIKSLATFTTLGLSSSTPSSQAPKGRIGSSLLSRLNQLHHNLPPRFHPAVQSVLAALPQIQSLPWVLTHGDLVPSNIIVSHPNTSSSSSPPNHTIAGLIDWTEAEYLPFGVQIHSLEEFLGIQQQQLRSETPEQQQQQPQPQPQPSPIPIPPPTSKKYPPPGSKFKYFPEADILRQIFWTELERNLHSHRPDLFAAQSSSEFLETVHLSRLLGVLLWHGIAFDDGRLDRVVCEGVDDEEIQRLDVTLLGKGVDGLSLNS